MEKDDDCFLAEAYVTGSWIHLCSIVMDKGKHKLVDRVTKAELEIGDFDSIDSAISWAEDYLKQHWEMTMGRLKYLA